MKIPNRLRSREETPNPFEGLEAQGELNRLLDELFGDSINVSEGSAEGRGRRHADERGIARRRTRPSTTGVGAQTR